VFGSVLALCTIAASGSLVAQPAASRDSTPVRQSVPAVGLWLATGAITASAFDGGWERTIQGTGPQSSTTLRSAARFGNSWGSPGAIVAAGALWLNGRLFHDSTRARIGGRALEALALSGTVTGGIKGLAGRARPFADPSGPASWAFARGIHDARYQSFPSGHATAAFAFASAITAQLDRDRSPLARWAGPVLYSLAAVTAFARTYNNKHWASDVIAGAGVGTLSGLAVVRWHEAHAASWIDRVLLGR
ncbi:MAG: phosphatase PAP2 family protein, partial [Gemmatimonadales bacterium]